MYHKHSTEGIVIRGRERGEGNKVVTILSKEFGVIYATVQNGRSASSKHRSSVEDLTLGNFSLIRGKHGWKLVGAEAKKNIWFTSVNKSHKVIIAQILSLVTRLGGEERNNEIYNIVEEFLNREIDLSVDIDSDILKSEELVAVLRILKSFGYVKENDEEIKLLAQDKRQATLVINDSLKMADIL